MIDSFLGGVLKNSNKVSKINGKKAFDWINETEQLIQRALNDIAKDRTTIVIAHRLSTIRNADNIIVLSDSSIIEEGTHDELVKKENGYYAALWNIQTGQQITLK